MYTVYKYNYMALDHPTQAHTHAHTHALKHTHTRTRTRTKTHTHTGGRSHGVQHVYLQPHRGRGRGGRNPTALWGCHGAR